MAKNNPTVEAVQRTVSARFNATKQAIDNFIDACSTQGSEERKEAARVLVRASGDLFDLLAQADRPVWLTDISRAAQDASRNSQHISKLLRTITAVYSEVRDVLLPMGESSPFDFDAIFDQLRDQYGLPDLFDKLIDEITTIIESGHVDSVSALSALESIVAALRANRTGSYVSMLMSFDYAKFSFNFAKNLLKMIPFVKQFVDSVEETLKDGTKKFAAAKTGLHGEVMEMLSRNVRNFDRISGEPVVINLPGPPTHAQTSDDDALDAEFEVRPSPDDPPPTSGTP